MIRQGFEPDRPVAVVGVGHSQIGRRLPRPLGLLAADAVRAAVTDAGLELEDIDGAATFPAFPGGNAGSESGDGRSFVSTGWLVSRLGLRNVRWWAETQSGNVSTAIEQAVMALAFGRCDYAVVWRALHMPRSGAYQRSHDGGAVSDADAYSLPYGLTGAPMTFALAYMRYLKQYRADRDALGALVVAQRRGANRNPSAYFRDTPLTLADYLAAPMIAEPLNMLDCDIPVDGAGAIVLTGADRAESLPHAPAFVTGLGQASFLPGRPTATPLDLGPALFDGSQAHRARDRRRYLGELRSAPRRCRRGNALRRVRTGCLLLAGGAGLLRRGRGVAVHPGRASRARGCAPGEHLRREPQ